MKTQSTKFTFLAGIAIGIYAIETLIPKPFPWLRLGLSNAVVLCVVVIFGLKKGLIVSILRTTVGSLITGTFLTPFFFFGLSGGIASTCVMWVFYALGKKTFSLIGISIMGALAHNVVQLYVAYIMYIKRPEVFYLLPVFLLLSVVMGSITGIGAIYLKKLIEPSFKQAFS
ncbi:Gx transporter family protein [candidate division WOR-3 bacterium]|nr:Gx transporter family protein [candidate division WOR-3 bacterium]